MVFSWQMAEELAAAHMRSIGFSDARRMPDGADAGIDVVSQRAVAQVKYHAAAIGGPDVQRLRGAGHGMEHLLFYSASGYTRAALDAAERAGIALFVYSSQTNEVSGRNSLAMRIEGSDVSPARPRFPRGLPHLSPSDLAKFERFRVRRDVIDYIEAMVEEKPYRAYPEMQAEIQAFDELARDALTIFRRASRTFAKPETTPQAATVIRSQIDGVNASLNAWIVEARATEARIARYKTRALD